MNKYSDQSKEKNNRSPKQIIIFLTFIMIFILAAAIIFSSAGCKAKASETQQSINSTESEISTSSSTESKSLTTTEKETKTATSTAKETSKETAKETESATETTEQIPANITDLIKEANNYYSSGEYGFAKNSYRKAEIAINDSDLSEQSKQSLVDSFYSKYKKSKDIIESARTHYANAMQLEYETRYQEAKSELEAALAIYPKYAEAIEAYENLKILMGLE